MVRGSLGRETMLWCAWLAWSRFRVVIPTWDRTLPTVVACLDETLAAVRRQPDLCPDRQRADGHDRSDRRHRRAPSGDRRRRPPLWASDHRLCAVRSRVQGRQRSDGSRRQGRPRPDRGEPPAGIRLLRRAPGRLRSRSARPSTVESTARPTKPRPIGSRPNERACTRSRPRPYTVAFGVTRLVDDDATLRFGSARYSVPHALVGERVWVRVAGDELVVTFAARDGAREVARHALTTPGNPRIDPAHYPARTCDPLHPKPKPGEPGRGGLPGARARRRALARPRRGVWCRADPNEDPPGDRARDARRLGPGRASSRSRCGGRPLRRRRSRVDRRPPATPGRAIERTARARR